VKVRILEGRTSAEVLDFNLFLSPNDVWTAAIIPSDASDTSAGRIITSDASCTAPQIPTDGQPFRNTQYVAQAAGLGRDLARTREGYIEIIEMASLTGATADAVTHVNGVPDDCDAVRTNDTSVIVNVDGLPPSGGLTGTGTLINVNSGMDAGYKPDALDAFSDSILYTGPGSTSPALADATPPTSVVFNNGYNPGAAGGSIFATVYRSEFISPFTDLTDGAMATASVFMHEAVLNEYVLDTGTASLTLLRDWLQRLTGVTIRPVLDPTRTDAVDAHDPPAWMREVVILRDRHCVFPGCPATPAPATSTTSSPTRHRLLMAVPSPQLEGVGTTPRR